MMVISRPLISYELFISMFDIFLCIYFVNPYSSVYLDVFASMELCFKMHTLYIRGVRFSSCPSLGTSALITSREWHTGKGASGDSLVAMTT
jgi:hypothetical protein